MRLLVTGCWIKNGGVYLLDTESGDVREINDQHARGACFHDGMAFITRTEEFEVWDWEETLKQKGKRPQLIFHERLKGWEPHDVKVKDGYLYMNRTGQNRIIRRKLGYSGRRTWEEVFTMSAEDWDQCHVNSFDFNNDSIIASAFSIDKIKRKKWRDIGLEGFIFEVTGPRHFNVLIDRMDHPHSARFTNDGVAYCNSRKESVYFDRKNHRLGGYLRGLHLTEDRVYVGRSRTRFPEALGPDRKYSCAVLEVDRKSGEVLREFEIPTIEIYEVVEVPK